MKIQQHTLAALGALVLVLQILLTQNSTGIVNAHESIENFNDVAKLQSAMDKLNIERIILHGIPEDLLRYDGNEVQLSEVDENNAILAEVTETFPHNFDFFCSLNPEDEELMAHLDECIEAGAKGVKFYVGYSYAHTCNIDDPNLDPFYEAMEEAGMILMLPVNQKFESELVKLLSKHPDLNVICPHYCLSSKDLPQLSTHLGEHENLYIDISFGHVDFVREGFERISGNVEGFQEFFEENADRILFATANVITSYEDKDSEFVVDLYNDYLMLLQEESFESSLDPGVEYQGLSLSRTVLNKVFWKNIEGLLE